MLPHNLYLFYENLVSSEGSHDILKKILLNML